jgi:ATP-binding cassette subfamily A (ABC1) protein 3
VLADSATVFAATQYGGIYFTHDNSSTVEGNGTEGSPLMPIGMDYADLVRLACVLRKGDYLDSDECDNYAGIGYVIRYNFTAMHATLLYQTLADEAIVKEALNDKDFRIKTTIHPLPQSYIEVAIGKGDDAFSAWFLVVLSFPFITGSFATFVLSERESKAKHLQTVAGVQPAAYWLSTWLWDVANYQIPLWITVMLMFAFDIDIFTTTERGVVGGVITLLLLFGPANASYAYCVSFMFSSPSACNLFIIISGFLIGFGGAFAAFILRMIGSDPSDPKHNLVNVAIIVEWVLRFIPAFNLSKGLFNILYLDAFEFMEGQEITVWHDTVLLYEVIFLAWQSVVYLLLAMQLDQWSSNPRAVSIWRGFVKIVTFQYLCPSGHGDSFDFTMAVPEDDDVLAEEERVLTGRANDDLVVLSQLTKVYNNGKLAVNNVSLGIPPGECFGLLGINGAGRLA